VGACEGEVVSVGARAGAVGTGGRGEWRGDSVRAARARLNKGMDLQAKQGVPRRRS